MLGLAVLWVLLLNSVSEARTPPRACGQSEEWRKCGPAPDCAPTCDTLGERVCCVLRCAGGCHCIDGHIRDPKNKCVPVEACPSPGLLSFEQLEVTVLEGDKVAVLTVVRVTGSHGRITVRWRVHGASGPYAVLTGQLIFEDEVLSQTIRIPITDNDIREPDIRLRIELFEPSEKTNVQERRGWSTVTIKDDDMRPGYPEMESLSQFVSESAGVVSVRVVRIDGQDGRLSVSWKTVSGTAEERGDFFSNSGKLVFEDGIKEQIISIKIKDDDVREGREAFRVELYDPLVAPGVLNFRARGSRLSTLINIEDDDMTPGYPEMAATKVLVKESDGRVLIRVVRRDGSDGSISIKYRLEQGTALPSSDYIPLSTEGLLVFPEGVTEQTITVQLVDDGIREKEERFRVVLFDAAPGPGVIKFRARGNDLVTEVIVTDDDMTPGFLELERESHIVTERVEALRVWVHRMGGSDGVITCRWRTVAGAAVAAKDFVNASGELVFLEGETRKSFLVHIVDDSSREGIETFHVEIFDGKPGPGVLNFKGLGGRTRTDITIQDDDMNPGQLVLESSTLEVLENVRTVKLTVVRIDGFDGEIRVHWRTVGKAAFFESSFGELVFKEGEKKQEISIQIIDNDIRNIEKRFFEVELYDPTAGPGVVNFRGLGGITRTVINVKDDDANPGTLELQESTFSIVEGVPTVSTAVVRTGGADGKILVHWRTVSTVTTFTQVRGTIEFEEGVTRQMITVLRPAGDFQIELFDPRPELEVVHFRGLGNRAASFVRLNQFLGVLNLEEPIYNVTEAVGSVSIGVVRTFGTNGEVRVHYRTVPETAEEGKDYEGTSGVLIFHPNQHLQFITIRILDDNVKEPQKRFAVELFQVTTAVVADFRGLGNVVRTVVIINDDDRAAEPQVFFTNTTLEVARDSDLVVFQLGRSDDGADQPLNFFLETLQYQGEGAAIPNVDYKNTRGMLTFVANAVGVKSMVNLLPNPNNRAPFKVFLVRISIPFGQPGVVTPGKDILRIILKDVDAFFLQGQTSVEVTSNVKTEIQDPPPPPPPPPAEFRGGEHKEAHKCPAGLTFKECEPSCQKKCNGNNAPPPCHLTCVRGCFCPGGMFLDEATNRCVTECAVSKCPFGMTFKECAHACPETCPGMDFLNSATCHGGGCIKGCYCPVGKVLDHTLKNCVTPSQCSGGQGFSPRGLAGGLSGLQGQAQGGLLQGQVQGQVQGAISGRGLPVGGLQGGLLQGQIQGQVQGGGLLGGVGGGLLGR